MAKSRRNLLRGSKDYVAQNVSIRVGDDEYSFSLRELSAKAQVEVEEWPEKAAADLGISVETITDSDALAQWLAEHNRDRHEASGLSVAMRFTQLLEEQWDIALLDGLVGWDLGEDLTPENIKLLPLTVKRPLFRALQAGTTLGVGAEQFFR